MWNKAGKELARDIFAIRAEALLRKEIREPD
jgi:hypothetical protein